MHGQFRKRMAAVHPGLHGLARRVPQDYGAAYDDSGDDSGTNLLLTGPVTFTVTRTIDIDPVTSPSPASTTTTTTIASSYDSNYDSPYQSWNTLSPAMSTSSSAPPSSFAPAPQTTSSLSSVGPTNSTPAAGDVQPISGSAKTNGLPPGVLTGVIILCLFVFFTITFFLIRRRYVQRRIDLRKGWAKSKRSQFSSESNSFETKGPQNTPYSSPDMTTTATRPAAFPSPKIPGVSYGNDFAPAVVIKQSSSGAPVYGPPSSAPLSPSMATVVSTYITTLPDELSINVGEIVGILAEYDDGWALCLNARGEQGMVPMECLHGRFSIPSDEITVSRGMGGNLRRVSSLQPNVGNMRRF